MEEKIKQSEANFRQIIDLLPHLIFVKDANGVFLTVNKRLAELYGVGSVEMLENKNVMESIPVKEEGEKFLHGNAEVIASEKARIIPEVEFTDHTGEKRIFYTTMVPYVPVGKKDKAVLGIAIEITEQKKTERELDITLQRLEQRVADRTRELEDKNKNICDSINYAKRIQRGLLSNSGQIAKLFPGCFILSQPRDIISGDFFWCYQRRTKKFIVVADCTGHGVPGGLMSIIGNNLLNQIIIDEHIENPSEILETLDTRLWNAVKGDSEDVKDGMDITLCIVDTHFNELYFAGAYQSLFISDENGKVIELPASRHSIGGMQNGDKKFDTIRFHIINGQRIYLSSDGYYSQFGGAKDKRLKKSGFRKTLEELQPHPMTEQKNLLKKTLADWTGKNEQVDDVLVVGIEL